MAIKNRKTSSQEINQRKAVLDLAAARLVKNLITCNTKFCNMSSIQLLPMVHDFSHWPIKCEMKKGGYTTVQPLNNL